MSSHLEVVTLKGFGHESQKVRSQREHQVSLQCFQIATSSSSNNYCFLSCEKTTHFELNWGAQYLTEENIEVIWAEFSCLSWAVLLKNTINVQHVNDHFESWKLCPGFVLLAEVCPWLNLCLPRRGNSRYPRATAGQGNLKRFEEFYC